MQVATTAVDRGGDEQHEKGNYIDLGSRSNKDRNPSLPHHPTDCQMCLESPEVNYVRHFGHHVLTDSIRVPNKVNFSHIRHIHEERYKRLK